MKTYRGSKRIAPSFFTSALRGVEWSASCPGRFILGEIPPPPGYPLDRRLGGSQGRSGPCTKKKGLALARTPAVQFTARRYGDKWNAVLFRHEIISWIKQENPSCSKYGIWNSSSIAQEAYVRLLCCYSCQRSVGSNCE
jgi:hypothetical protein